MNWINNYLATVSYLDGGRGEDNQYDCWGLVREARHLHCGMRLLPSWGEVRNTNPRAFTKAYRTEAKSMQECRPEHGAVAAVFAGRICVHVGLVVDVGNGRLMVLEVNPHKRVNVSRVVDFEASYPKVIYYRD